MGYVALKIVKSAEHYTTAALDEIKLLNDVAKFDPTGAKHIVQLIDHFKHKGPNGEHVVMVFEVLGKHLLDLIEKHYKGLSLNVVKSITKQILIALAFLHEKPQIIHTDLKPENVLLMEPFTVQSGELIKQSGPVNQIKIADLGNACWTYKHFTDDIQTRQYRSPEVILRCGYDARADIWSLGCIVFELATGDLLFKPKKGDTHKKSEDHLALILELFGLQKYPAKYRKGKRAKDFFNTRGELKHIKSLKPWKLDEVLKEKYNFSEKDANEMSDFLNQCLQIDSDERLSAEEALKHPWLKGIDTTIPFPTEAPKYASDDE